MLSKKLYYIIPFRFQMIIGRQEGSTGISSTNVSRKPPNLVLEREMALTKGGER